MDSQSNLDIFVLAGEMSGDQLGAGLVESLLEIHPELKIGGSAGPHMRQTPFETLFEMEQFEVMGFVDVLVHLPRILKLMKQVKRTILARNPKCVVLIDYPGFNLKLAEKLRKCGYTGKIVQYVCPSVWAWKKGRIPKMARDLDLLLSLLPFEKGCFKETSLKVEYTGHPLAAEIEMGRGGDGTLLSIFPGSREKEVARNLSIQLAVAKRLKGERPELKVAILVAKEELKPLIAAHVDESVALYPREEKGALMAKSDFAIATSGTVVLELALHGVPTAVNYFISRFDEFLATKVFKINLPYYSLPNIIAGREIFPEFYGSNLTEEALYRGMRGVMEGDLPLEDEVRAPLMVGDPKKNAALAINNLIF